MYPFFRLAYQLWMNRHAEPIEMTGTHISHHICWPWDIDIFMELNNGRTLTLYDLGRFLLSGRVGMNKVLREQRWGLAVAGGSVRYRRRIRPFQRIEMLTRALGWDDKFVYIEQSMWVGETCCNHILLRTAVTDRSGIVAPVRLAEALGADPTSPELPEWARGWIEADLARPWPPAR